MRESGLPKRGSAWRKRGTQAVAVGCRTGAGVTRLLEVVRRPPLAVRRSAVRASGLLAVRSRSDFG